MSDQTEPTGAVFGPLWKCATCRMFAKLPEETECAECRRRRRYGLIVQALAFEADEPPFARSTLDALDALAELMIDRHRLIAAHRIEIRELERDAQRGARESYDEGRASAADAGW